MASSSPSSPPATADDGQERVMAVAKHIVKRLAVSKNAADDMARFLSTFDPRLLNLSSPEAGEEASDDEDEELIAAAEDVIRRCNSSSSSSGMTDYLYAVDDAIAAAPRSARAAAAVHAAMPRLEEELRSLLYSSSPRLSLSSDDHDDPTPDASPFHSGALSPQAAASFRGVAGRMLRAGYGPELAQVYVDVRRDALAESVARLGVEAVAIEEVLKMEWALLYQKIRRWSHAIRAVVRTLLAGERRLCDEVFELDEELGHECFADVARGCVLQLLGFADAVAMSARATEKLYRTLGMYEALADVQPDLEALFAGGAAREFIAGEVSSAVAQLGSTVRHTIEEFGDAIHGEASRRPVHGGEIHPMTRYVLNYCGLLADCRGTLDTVLGDAAVLDDGTAAASAAGAAASTPSARCMSELLTLLLRKMDDKSRLYDDAGLQNIFLMNNLYYVVQKVMDNLLAPKFRSWAGYLRASWIAVLSHLRDDGAPASPPAAQRALRDKARSFNAAFEDLYRSQTAWKVSDPQLREELRIAVSERLIPAYRSFVSRVSRHPAAARHVRYSLEDLESYMLDFFEGAQKFVRW
ncbi:hypothetical protein ACP70R_001235 [Stipagrostis hirtigluma subsp. patula]